jgi:hypothetical protein
MKILQDSTDDFGHLFIKQLGTKTKLKDNEERAKKLGFQKVSQLKLAVAKKINDYVFTRRLFICHV